MYGLKAVPFRRLRFSAACLRRERFDRALPSKLMFKLNDRILEGKANP
jgi:hypothetical protein